MPFSEIIGHDRTIALLKRSLLSNKVAHAYLFDGIEGCGKKKSALAFIETVFCETGEGCGTCTSCRKIANLQHPDLHLVEPDGTFIKVDQIRELQKALSYRPFQAPKKACIIDQADRLNPAAGNALLKTLEEPPGNALLILVTACPARVLPTIVSRCQRLQFAGLPSPILEHYLVEQGNSPETARIAASLAGGSMKAAIEVCAETSLEDRASILSRLEQLSPSQVQPLFAAAEEFASDKEKVGELLDLITVFLRDALLLHQGDADVANTDLMPLLKREAGRSSRERIMEKLRQVEEARQALARNANVRLMLDVLFMRLASA